MPNSSKTLLHTYGPLFVKRVTLTIFAFVLLASGTLALLLSSTPTPVQAATSSTLNFQGRLLNASGSLVPDGNYNIQFKIYDGGTQGGPVGQGEANAGTLLWTETRDFDGTDDRVRIANGYFSVNLGSVTAFPGTIPWDQELWITMSVRGSSTCAFATTCTPADGEMLATGNKRTKLTGIPYAFRAGAVMDAAGNAYTADNLIQNQNAADQTANFRISGTGRANTSFTTPLLDSISGVLGIGTTTATGLTLGGTTNTTNLTLQGAATATYVIGTANNTGGITLGNSTATNTINIGSSAGASNTQTITIGTSSTATSTTNLTLGSLIGTSATTIQSGSSGITLQAAGPSTTGVIQIGVGGAGSTTPDYLALDVKSTTGDPAGGTEGYMYYNTADNKFRCYQNTGWTDCAGGGGGQHLASCL